MTDAASRGITQVFYQELKEGDRRKIRAQSNDSRTGGGARDLRISPEDEFGPFFEILIPTTHVRRSNVRGDVTVRATKVHWNWDGHVEVKNIELWPPQPKRPAELRIASIDENFPDTVPTGDGRVFLILVRNDRGEIWGHYVTESQLRSGVFEPSVANPILACLDLTQKTTVRGYLDFEGRRSYCHE